MKFIKFLKEKKVILALIIVTIISSITIFTIKGMTYGHDIYFHMSRILAIKDNLKLGIIGGYIYPNYFAGYGYGNPLFYPDIFLYIPAFLNYIGINVVTSYKIFLVLINFACVITMYISVKGISKNKKGALISSIVYGFASYRLVDMYARAALGETLAFVFAPIVIYGMYKIIYDDYKDFYILVIGMTGLILSHLISTAIIGVVLVAMCLVNIKRLLKDKKRILYLLIAALLTVLLSGYYIFPMLEQMKSGNFVFNSIDNMVDLPSRTIPLWGILLETYVESSNLLWIPGGIGIGFIILIITYFKNFKKCTSFIHFLFITSIIALVCTLSIFPWEWFKCLSMIQFPWRLYLIATVLLSIGAGLIIPKIINLNRKKMDIKLIAFLIICTVIPMGSITIRNYFSYSYNSYNKYEISGGEYVPVAAFKNFLYNHEDIIKSSYPLDHSFKRNGLDLTIDFSNNNSINMLELPLLYYKGYSAKINGNNLAVFETHNGLVGVNLNNIEQGTIYVSYTGTVIQHASRIISILSLIGFTVYIVIKKRGAKDEK